MRCANLCAQFDVDLDGTLDEKELRRLLRKLGREASRSEVREIIAAADLNAVRERFFHTKLTSIRTNGWTLWSFSAS